MIINDDAEYTVHLFNTTNEENEMKEVGEEEGEMMKEASEMEKNELKLSQNVYILSPGEERRIQSKLDEEAANGAAILNVKLKKVKEDDEDDENDKAGLVVLQDVEKGEEGKVRMEKRDKDGKEGTKKEKVVAWIVNYYTIIRGFSASYWLVVALMVIFMTDLYTCTAFLTDYLYLLFSFYYYTLLIDCLKGMIQS